MTSPETPLLPNVTVEPFPQNGPYGCATACLANAGRFLLGITLTPDDVDNELARTNSEDLLGYDRTLWLLRRGLSVHALVDPKSMIGEGYLNGTDTYDEMLTKFADRYYAGDLHAATEDYGSQDYREFIQKLKDKKPSYDAELGIYASTGRYTEELRPVQEADLVNALRGGKVALIACAVEGSLGHQQLLFPQEADEELSPAIYDPDENESLIFDVDVHDMLETSYMDKDEVYIVSR